MPASVNSPTDMHLPADQAPTPTFKVARCKVCGDEWEVQSFDNTDAKGCAFCGASKKAIVITSEKPSGFGATVYD